MTEYLKQKVNVETFAQDIVAALKSGVLLNTNGDKFNSMVIGWGGLGTCWSRPVFTVYVREHRYTKEQLDKTGEFTISIPLKGSDPEIVKTCGWKSGREIDKVFAPCFLPIDLIYCTQMKALCLRNSNVQPVFRPAMWERAPSLL